MPNHIAAKFLFSRSLLLVIIRYNFCCNGQIMAMKSIDGFVSLKKHSEQNKVGLSFVIMKFA